MMNFRDGNMSWRVKKYHVVFRFVVLQMRLRSPLFRLQTCEFCLKLPQGFYKTFATSKDSGETALMRRLA